MAPEETLTQPRFIDGIYEYPVSISTPKIRTKRNVFFKSPHILIKNLSVHSIKLMNYNGTQSLS